MTNWEQAGEEDMWKYINHVNCFIFASLVNNVVTIMHICPHSKNISVFPWFICSEHVRKFTHFSYKMKTQEKYYVIPKLFKDWNFHHVTLMLCQCDKSIQILKKCFKKLDYSVFHRFLILALEGNEENLVKKQFYLKKVNWRIVYSFPEAFSHIT